MRLSVPSFSGKRWVNFLSWAKWLAFPLVLCSAIVWLRVGVWWIVLLLLSLFTSVALHAWENSHRRQFIREARMPRFLGAKLREQYPQLSVGDAELVLRGLRQFFMAHQRSDRKFVAMPSKLVDAAWHEFILHTRAYEDWCKVAFGKLMHHTPAEVLGSDPKRNDGLRRAWFWACKEESIDPRLPTRLPLLFALDKKFAIPGGFSYQPDCKDIDRQSGSDAYCGTAFSSGSSDGGASGDFGGLGGSDGGGGDGGGDGGCGGGCGGGD